MEEPKHGFTNLGFEGEEKSTHPIEKDPAQETMHAIAIAVTESNSSSKKTSEEIREDESTIGREERDVVQAENGVKSEASVDGTITVPSLPAEEREDHIVVKNFLSDETENSADSKDADNATTSELVNDKVDAIRSQKEKETLGNEGEEVNTVYPGVSATFPGKGEQEKVEKKVEYFSTDKEISASVDPESRDQLKSKTQTKKGQKRQIWNNPIEFLLSCIAMSVGLGNIWRFPYTAYTNGGGAFLIPYLIVLILIGRPIYFLEMVLGQFSGRGSVKCWKVLPFFKGVGYGQAIATWCVVTFYCVLMSISFFFLFSSFGDPLPWSECNPDWADENCYASGANNTGLNFESRTSSSQQYFENYVLRKKDNIDDGIGVPDWRMALILLLCWLIIFLVLSKGVASSGKVAYFTALFPYVVLVTLLIRAATLPGAADGILFFITPQWDKILDPNVWYNAVTQCFFSLSVGFGPIITFSSHNPFEHNIYRDATIISCVDTLTSILAGITIFAVLGNLAVTSGRDIESVVTSGTGLAFVSYPEALTKFDAVPQFFSAVFFLMLITLAIGSATGLSGCVIDIIADMMPKVRKLWVTAGVCVAGFLVGLVYVTPGGLYILDLVDYFGGGFIIYVMVIAQTMSIFWIYGLDKLLNDIRFMLNIGLGIYWKFTWCIFLPLSLTVIFIYAMTAYKPLETSPNVPYPVGATVAGWVLAAIAILQIPIWALHSISKQPGRTWNERMRMSLTPAQDWGPKDPTKRQQWLEYTSKRPKRFAKELWSMKIFRPKGRIESPETTH